MPDALSDPSPAFYIVAVVIGLIAVGLWARKRDKAGLVSTGLILAAIALLVIVDFTNESPREQAVRKVGEISEAINAKDEAKFTALVSDKFAFKTLKKADVKKVIELAKQYDVRTAAWDFDRSRAKTYKNNEGVETVEIVFDAKGELKTGEPMLKHFKATFVKDPDGQYRLQTFVPYNIAKKEQGGEEDIPGL